MKRPTLTLGGQQKGTWCEPVHLQTPLVVDRTCFIYILITAAS